MVMKALSFCYSGNVFNPPSFLKDSSHDLELSFSILNTPFIQAFKVSVKKSAICLGGISLYVMSCFPLDAFKTLSDHNLSGWSSLGLSALGSLGLPIPRYPSLSRIWSFQQLFLNPALYM